MSLHMCKINKRNERKCQSITEFNCSGNQIKEGGDVEGK